MINAIVCADSNWGIGKKNGLLYNIKADMEFFKLNTRNSIVVMGENTLLSFPGSKPLKDRVNIVLCPEGHEYKGCICLHNFDQLVNFVKILAKQYEVWVIGGGMMYKSMLPYYDRVLVTKVDNIDSEATVFFPNLDETGEFDCYCLNHPSKDYFISEDGLKYKFMCYERKMTA